MTNADNNEKYTARRNEDELSPDEIDQVAGGKTRARNDDADEKYGVVQRNEDELSEDELGNVAGGKTRARNDDADERYSARRNDENDDANMKTR